MEAYRHIFSSFRFGNVEVKNRIATPPMLSCLATPDGFVTREMIAFYQSFARGGAGIINIGDTAVDREYAPAHFGQLIVGDDRIIAGLSTLVEAVQKYGAKISIELDHSGRLSPPAVIGGKNPIGPSPIPAGGEATAARAEGGEAARVTEMDREMIAGVIDNFVNACARCLKAGFEMVTIHGGHGQLLSQFVSPLANQRADEYGGSLENRARFILELLSAIREKVGDRLALEYRVSADEIAPGGMHAAETIQLLKMIEDKIDLINVSVGGMIAGPLYLPHMAQPAYFPHAYNVQRAANIKKNVRVPVTCVGSIIDLAMADNIIAQGKADIVALGRAHVADPDLVRKTRRGDAADVRPCLRCNVCGERPAKFFPVRCAVNPVIGRELEYRYLPPAEPKKKIVIVGGGPAGMQAALIAAARGHQVVLYEKEQALGGALRMAAALSFKSDMKRYLEWILRQIRKAPVQVNLETCATVELIAAEKPDALIVAAGAEPVIPDMPGIKRENVVWVGDVNTGKASTGKSVLVAGAGMSGCETALHLARQQKNTTIIDIIAEPEIARDCSLVGRLALLELLRQEDVEFRTETALEEITDRGAIVVDKNKNRCEIAADTMVLALGVRPRKELLEAFDGLAPEVHAVGDCSGTRNLMGAIHAAFHLAAEI